MTNAQTRRALDLDRRSDPFVVDAMKKKHVRKRAYHNHRPTTRSNNHER